MKAVRMKQLVLENHRKKRNMVECGECLYCENDIKKFSQFLKNQKNIFETIIKNQNEKNEVKKHGFLLLSN